MLMTTYKNLLVTIMVLKFLSIMMMRQKYNNATTIVTAFSSTTFSSTFTQSLKTSRIIRSSSNNNRHGAFRKSQIVMMPEGPEVRTLVDQLQPGVGLRLCDLQFVSGRYTRHGKPKGFEEFKKSMTYHKSDKSISGIDHITSWNAKGKFIWLTLDNGLNQIDDDDDDDYLRSIWITLGMSGRFAASPFHDDDDGTTHKQVRWYFEFLHEDKDEAKMRRIYYYDTRNFGTLRFSLSKKELEEKLNSLGPDILDDVTEKKFLDVLNQQRQSMNVCKFLMDQSKIAGVGNYILSEALYRANLDPYASLEEIDIGQRKKLYEEIIATATSSYEQQGMTRKGGSYKDVEGNEGKFAFSLQCYGREVCPEGRKIIRDTEGPHGRTIWYVEDQLFMPLTERFSSETSSKYVSKYDKTTQTSFDGSNEGSEIQLLDSLTDKRWKETLDEFLSSEKFDRISDFVASERERNTIYPPSQDVFAALNMCSFDKVKVVIIGQDPYHGPKQGHGLAFSVQKGIPPPPSLKNIFKELYDDIGIPVPDHGNLSKWAEQGVLLLNTVLTVQAGKANSHSKMGWEDFTDEIVEKLNNERNGLVFMLWGAPAAKKCDGIDQSKHFIIKTSHPSPLGATKTKSPFLGSKCFSRCNDILIANGADAIDWDINP